MRVNSSVGWYQMFRGQALIDLNHVTWRILRCMAWPTDSGQRLLPAIASRPGHNRPEVGDRAAGTTFRHPSNRKPQANRL